MERIALRDLLMLASRLRPCEAILDAKTDGDWDPFKPLELLYIISYSYGHGYQL